MAPAKNTRSGAKKQTRATKARKSTKSSTNQRPKTKKTAKGETRMKQISWRSAANNIMTVDKEEMRAVLRCTKPQLADLKIALRDAMQSKTVGDLPFLGQLPGDVDVTGVLMNEVWSSIENRKEVFRKMLSGGYWPAGRKPDDFEHRVQLVKRKIERDVTNTARRATAAYSGGHTKADEDEDVKVTGRQLRKRKTPASESSDSTSLSGSAESDESDQPPLSRKRRCFNSNARQQSQEENESADNESDGQSANSADAFLAAQQAGGSPDDTTSDRSVSAIDSDAEDYSPTEPDFAGLEEHHEHGRSVNQLPPNPYLLLRPSTLPEAPGHQYKQTIHNEGDIDAASVRVDTGREAEKSVTGLAVWSNVTAPFCHSPTTEHTSPDAPQDSHHFDSSPASTGFQQDPDNIPDAVSDTEQDQPPKMSALEELNLRTAQVVDAKTSSHIVPKLAALEQRFPALTVDVRQDVLEFAGVFKTRAEASMGPVLDPPTCSTMIGCVRMRLAFAMQDLVHEVEMRLWRLAKSVDGLQREVLREIEKELKESMWE